jgi:hypothetical protein
MKSKLLNEILLDIKTISKEYKIQLDTLESLQNENESLKKRFNQMFRESSLCVERDEMHMKRNVVLVRENKELKGKVNDLTMQMEAMKQKIHKQNEKKEQDNDGILWQCERLDMKVIKLQADLNESQKEKKQWIDENKRIRKLIQDS